MPEQTPISPIQKQLLADITKKVGELKRGFELAEQTDLRTVPEALFVRDFLPLFSGKDTTNRDHLLATWYMIAGSPYEVVNIINHLGDVVAQVPPVLNKNAITIPTTRGNNLASVFEEAKQRSAMSPRLGDGIINAELQKRLDSMELERDTQAMSPAWRALLNHYDKGAPGVSKAAVSNNADDSDFEMD